MRSGFTLMSRSRTTAASKLEGNRSTTRKLLVEVKAFMDEFRDRTEEANRRSGK